MNELIKLLRAAPEIAGQVGRGVAGSTIGGLAGLGTMMLPGRTGDDAQASLEYWQDKFSTPPERLETEAALHAMGKAGEAFEAPFKAAGEFTHDVTGSPTLAASVESIPQVLMPVEVMTRALRARKAKPDVDETVDPVQAGPGRSQAGIAQLVGTPGQQALLGKQMPRSIDSLDEMLGEADYKLGSSKGVYETNPVGMTARPTLTAAEREIIGGLPQAQRGAAEAALREYRATHHPAHGWADVEITGFKAGKGGRMKPVFQMRSPMFHQDPKTGKAYKAGSVERAARVEELSNKMADEVKDVVARAGKGDENAKFITDQARWYTDAEKTIKGLFGIKAGELYANIEGSLSPNTRLSQQHVMARDVFDRFMRGEFDDTLARFDEHMAKRPKDVSEQKWARKAPDDAIIRKTTTDPETGELKKYGMNSTNATMALRGLLQKAEPGQAPKMRNFAANLAGKSTDPTIDVWAGRTVQRLSGGKRMPPSMDAGVPGNIAAGKAAKPYAGEKATAAGPEITGQYGMANDVFKTAARKMGMDPHDLQALMWFREKELWENNAWTPQDKSPSLVQHIEKDYPEPLNHNILEQKMRVRDPDFMAAAKADKARSVRDRQAMARANSTLDEMAAALRDGPPSRNPEFIAPGRMPLVKY